MPEITRYSHPLPKFQQGDYIGMNADATLLVQLCHCVYRSVHETNGVADAEAELWHTQEDQYVVLESRKTPVLIDRTQVDEWVFLHGGSLAPEPDITLIPTPLGIIAIVRHPEEDDVG